MVKKRLNDQNLFKNKLFSVCRFDAKQIGLSSFQKTKELFIADGSKHIPFLLYRERQSVIDHFIVFPVFAEKCRNLSKTLIF